MLIDLQVHSTYSDGYLSPTDVVRYLASKKVRVASLTDHNTVGGLDEFKWACKQHKIKPINGLELYVKYKNKKMNLLWYNFNEDNTELHGLLRDTHVRRRAKVRNILTNLKKRGFIMDIDKILDRYNRYIPINRLVDEIISSPENFKKVKKELDLKFPREEDVIHNYFRNRDLGVLEESYTSLERVIKLRHQIGGQLILCHPAKYNYIYREVWAELNKLGIDGVEILSPHHNYGAIMYIQYLAREFNFIETGGSDFHRPEGNNFPIQNSWDYFEIKTRFLRGVSKIIG
ncbi:MAG: PHP domain-containing protein [Patescibacteria group bacterium]|nr:PHP domain-containing protein [Patescibacteria group bacterium]MDD4610555.1 PHP domain-containing protein [Patescibacteria group bacterium]